VQLHRQEIWNFPETKLADLRRTQFGFVFQFTSLLPNLRAIDNVALPSMLDQSRNSDDVYANARDLIERTGLGSRSDAYPSELSGGEQRRVVIARALINRPRFLLADEPTGDLDEDTENEIIDLFESLRRQTRFGMILVTHSLSLAKRADRAFVMESGILRPFVPPADVQEVVHGARGFALPPPANDEAPAQPADAGERRRLGGDLWRHAGRAIAVGVFLFAAVLGTNSGIERYQNYQLQQRRDRLAALEELAMSTLRGDISSIKRVGDNRFRVDIYLENSAGADRPIYIMSPSVHAFVQVGLEWRELPTQAIGEATASVLKVVGRQIYSYEIESHVPKYTELLPYYMHVRFNNNMLVSPESKPKDELFSREDNYYVYLRPDGIDDATIAKRVKFAGPPPLWIWMPPH
jgi:putative ABC transport system ATP-binding protein/macrolide transport system ATP-binding/permease protein/lipoprotein-releasing system ATP-binding protein